MDAAEIASPSIDAALEENSLLKSIPMILVSEASAESCFEISKP